MFLRLRMSLQVETGRAELKYSSAKKHSSFFYSFT